MKESEHLELKKSTSQLKEAVIAIVAILNKHRKGKLCFGIKNDGTVIGQQLGESTLRDVSRAKPTGFQVTFSRHMISATPLAAPPDRTTKLESEILSVLTNKPRISRTQLADSLGIKIDTVKEYIRKLKSKKC